MDEDEVMTGGAAVPLDARPATEVDPLALDLQGFESSVPPPAAPEPAPAVDPAPMEPADEPGPDPRSDSEPATADPEPADPEPADPEPADPEPADPEPADPEPADPEPEAELDSALLESMPAPRAVPPTPPPARAVKASEVALPAALAELVRGVERALGAVDAATEAFDLVGVQAELKVLVHPDGRLELPGDDAPESRLATIRLELEPK